MSRWYPASGLSWQQYLQAKSVASDIQAELVHQARATSLAIDTHSLSIVGSYEQIQTAFSTGLDHAAASLQDLAAQFDYSVALMLDELQVQSKQLQAIVQHLDAIKNTLENPLLTQARELFRIGCDRLAKGLLDKALESFLEAERKNDADFFIEYYLGKLYLYGQDDDDDVIDPIEAKRHLLAAARYGKAEMALDQSFRPLAASALLHASIACYAQAGSDAAPEAISDALALAEAASEMSPDLLEATFHCAKYRALQGDAHGSLEALCRAIECDARYSAKALADGAFETIRSDLLCCLDGLRLRTAKDSEAALAEASSRLAIAARFFPGWSSQGNLLYDGARAAFAEAEAAHSTGTYFGYLQAIEHALLATRDAIGAEAALHTAANEHEREESRRQTRQDAEAADRWSQLVIPLLILLFVAMLYSVCSRS